MADMLTGKKIAFLAKRGVEEPELTEPWAAVEAAGGEPVLVSDELGQIEALIGDWDRGATFDVDITAEAAMPDDYAALILPGGTLNADKMRTHPAAQEFVRSFVEAGKPIAAICHGPWILVECDAVRDKTMTSTTRIRTDLENAGAQWVDEEFVVDGALMTSRSPRDLDAFCLGIVQRIAEA